VGLNGRLSIRGRKGKAVGEKWGAEPIQRGGLGMNGLAGDERPRDIPICEGLWVVELPSNGELWGNDAQPKIGWG